MAIKLPPKVKKQLVEILQKEYQEGVKENSKLSPYQDFDVAEEIKKVLTDSYDSLRAEAEKLTPGSGESLDKARAHFNPDQFLSLVKNYIRVEAGGKAPERTFYKKAGPKEKEYGVHNYLFNHNRGEFPPEFVKFLDANFKDSPSTDEILAKLSKEDLASVLGALKFPHSYTKKDGLKGVFPKKSGYLFFTLGNIENLVNKIENILAASAPGESEKMTQEELIEKLISFISTFAEAKEQYYGSEEYALGGDSENYAAEDAEGKSLEDIKSDRNLDQEIVDYIDRLEAVGVDEDDIKKMLIDSGEGEYDDSYRSMDNEIGSYYMSSEEQFDFSDYDDEDYEAELAAAGLPYGSISANFALLKPENIEKLKKSRDLSCGIDLRPSDLGGSELHDITIYLSDQRRVGLIVDATQFAQVAKRAIKDKKLEKRGLKKPTVKTSLESDMGIKVEAESLPKKKDELSALGKKEAIATLYEAIGRHVFEMEDAQLEWMKSFIMTKMTDNEARLEWDFIKKGNVNKLLKLFKAMRQPGVAERHEDRVIDLAILHQEIVDGLMATKEAGGEIDDKTYKMVEDVLMKVTDEFIEEIEDEGFMTLPEERKKLIQSDADKTEAWDHGDDAWYEEMLKKKEAKKARRAKSTNDYPAMSNEELKEQYSTGLSLLKDLINRGEGDSELANEVKSDIVDILKEAKSGGLVLQQLEKVKSSSGVVDQTSAKGVVKYILDSEREENDYFNNAAENGHDPFSLDYQLTHVWGLAHKAFGLTLQDTERGVRAEGPLVDMEATRAVIDYVLTDDREEDDFSESEVENKAEMHVWGLANKAIGQEI